MSEGSKRVAVVLSGCGHQDGAEVTEAVSVLISLSQLGAEISMFAPSLDFEPVNHLTRAVGGLRDVLTESARIARGQIKDLALLETKDFDAIVFPGGSGAALRLSSWADRGAECGVLPDVERVIKEFFNEGKPIGAVCIAPTLIAKVIGFHGISLTIGDDPKTIGEIEKTGAIHEACQPDDYISDREHKVVTTPAYMFDTKPHLVFAGIQKAMRELVEMA